MLSSILIASLLFLATVVSGETFITDNAGNGISLPQSGGEAGQALSVDSSMAITPYILNVFIRDEGNTESFFFNSLDFNVGLSRAVTLINATFAPNGNNAALCSSIAACTGTSSSPVTANGTYTFTFNIPAQQTAFINLTYDNAGPVPLPLVDKVTLTIFNPFPAGPGANIVGDPQFVGLRGQSYQVHGIDGAVYNIISEESTQVNSRFVFLTEGACPAVDATNCWSHPGSYMGELSFQAVVEGKMHAALVQAGSAKTGFSGVQVDGKALKVGDKVTFGSFSVEMIDSHSVAVTTENYAFQLSNSDMFINQALRATVPLSKLTSHGLLGQTHSVKTYASAIKYIAGEVDDYVIADGNIFGTDFAFNKFNL